MTAGEDHARSEADRIGSMHADAEHERRILREAQLPDPPAGEVASESRAGALVVLASARSSSSTTITTNPKTRGAQHGYSSDPQA